MMFVAREEQLRVLEEHYHSDRFEFGVVYGRRRVGKTMLIREFIYRMSGKKNTADCRTEGVSQNDRPADGNADRDKRGKTAAKGHIYYMSVEGTAIDNLTGLSQALMRREGAAVEGARYDSFEMLLHAVDTICGASAGDRWILAIDEYPYLAASFPAISSLLQRHIDLQWKDSRLFLILCGSSMSFMETQVLGYKSPLYGRRTFQCLLKPFTFFEARQMLTAWPAEEAALLYGATGGIPDYLDNLDAELCAEDNLKKLFFRESGRLQEEPVNLLRQELRSPASYHSILNAIAGGASRLNEIAQKAGLETGGCSNMLHSLIVLGIVRKETPITEKESARKTLYRLEDGMFRFWYRFVRPYLGGISMGLGDVVFEQNVRRQLSDFMGQTFEEICRQYLYLPNVYISLPHSFTSVGRWWGTNPSLHRQEEIDIAAPGEGSLLLGECKWRNEQVSEQVLRTLLRRGDLFGGVEKDYICFSRSGFEESAVLFAGEHGIRLVNFADMTADVVREAEN